jgi:hypothetical protein
MTDDEFLAAFEAASFTRPEWTHEAHIRMAWLYLMRYPATVALERVRSGIQKLNAKIGSTTPEQQVRCIRLASRPGTSTGYHETITLAFVRVIAGRLNSNEDFATFRKRNPDLFDRARSVLLRHYTKERLHSPEAQNTFVEPDLEPLPPLVVAGPTSSAHS